MEEKNSDITAQNKDKNKGVKKGGFTAGLSKWLANLTGRGGKATTQKDIKEAATPRKLPEEPTVVKNLPGQTTTIESEDAVLSDINKAKNIFRSAFKKVSVSAAPAVNEGKEKGQETLKAVGKVVDVSFMRKMVRLLMVMLFIFVAGVLIFRFFKIVQEGGGNNDVPATTPAVSITYIPFRESIYATDPDILRLEESVNTLKREVVNAKIPVTDLSTPVLDFNVSF